MPSIVHLRIGLEGASGSVALADVSADRGVMAVNLRSAVVALFAGGAVSWAILGAPIAAASGADVTIAALQAEGYTVNINYVNGASKGLSECTVTNVNNPSSSPAPGDTVYVDVMCPNHDDGGFGFGVGIG
jgi:hypothetical protein